MDGSQGLEGELGEVENKTWSIEEPKPGKYLPRTPTPWSNINGLWAEKFVSKIVMLFKCSTVGQKLIFQWSSPLLLHKIPNFADLSRKESNWKANTDSQKKKRNGKWRRQVHANPTRKEGSFTRSCHSGTRVTDKEKRRTGSGFSLNTQRCLAMISFQNELASFRGSGFPATGKRPQRMKKYLVFTNQQKEWRELWFI